jgi:hypothetical protein
MDVADKPSEARDEHLFRACSARGSSRRSVSRRLHAKAVVAEDEHERAGGKIASVGGEYRRNFIGQRVEPFGQRGSRLVQARLYQIELQQISPADLDTPKHGGRATAQPWFFWFDDRRARGEPLRPVGQ